MHQQSLPNRILWCALGTAYECMGEIKLAMRAYQKCLDVEPNNEWLKSVFTKLGTDGSQTGEGEKDKDFNFWLDMEEVEPRLAQTEERAVYQYFETRNGSVHTL